MENNEANAKLQEQMGTLGETLMPITTILTGMLTKALAWFNGLDAGTQKFIVSAVLLAAVLLPIVSIGSNLLQGISSFITISGGMPSLISTISGAFSGLSSLLSGAVTGAIGGIGTALSWLAANPFVLVIAAIAALVVAILYLWNNCEAFREFWIGLWESITTWCQTTIENIVAYFSALPGRISEAIQGAITVVTNWGSNMLNQAVSYISNLVSSVHARISQIPGLIMSSLQSALSGLINWGSNMKAKATSAIDNVRSAISSGLERVKSLFNFSWSLPHIRLPHFNISGSFSLSPPSVPRISVAWYAKGGILNGAQIFGSLGNKLLGGGEAGPEAVLPLSGFYSELRSILASFIGSPAESIDMSALYSRLDGIYERLGRLQVVLDTGTLVGETVDQYDAALAERQMLAARGV